MKKKRLVFLCAVVTCLCAAFAVTGCGGNPSAGGGIEDEWPSNPNGGEEQVHDYGNDNICDICGYVKPLYIRVNASGEESANGKYILFGSYPQKDVTGTLGATLTPIAGALPTEENNHAWISYKYYLGTGLSGTESNSVDYMWYQDLTYQGGKYRAVYFTSYRPYYTSYVGNASNSKQDDNGYDTGIVYWFKFQPIKWEITEEKDGDVTLLCEYLIDSQEFHDTLNNQTVNGSAINASNYEYSRVRAWLNDTFYGTAFGQLEQEIIQTVTVNNGSYATGDSSELSSNDTRDKVWLLSRQEVYAIEWEELRQKRVTDYAKSQGIYAYNGKGHWWLRNPISADTYYADYVYNEGNLIFSFVNSTRTGICPAIKIQLSNT